MDTIVIDYDHLRPPLSSLYIKHSEFSIVKAQKGNPLVPYKRSVFYLTDLEPRERSAIQEVMKIIDFDEPRPPSWWRKRDTLRFVYEFGWDTNVICEVNNPD